MDFFIFVLKIAALTLGCGIAFGAVAAGFGVAIFVVKAVFEFSEAYAAKKLKELKQKYGLE